MTIPPSDQTRYVDAEEPGSSGADFELSSSVENALVLPYQMGEYNVLELIGSGGMGQVYRAEHRRMARPVALKTLRPELISNAAAIDRFYAEVRAAARVIHPNLVVAFDAGESDQLHFLAMELVPGETLSKVVSEGGPLGEAEAVRIIRDAALGLLAAHRAGIVHRDVKPSNIMLLPDGHIKVLDLGLATISNEAEQRSGRGKLVGTIEFMAPEQLFDPDAADQRSDIYSLGATLFYLLVGRPPFEGTVIEQARAHRDESPPELYRFRHDADLRLDHIVRRMLAKRPDQRYQDMQEVADELQPLLSSVGTTRPARDGSSRALDIGSTIQSLSTSSAIPAVLGIDLGLYYLSAAIAEPGGKVQAVAAGGHARPLLRSAVASENGRVLVGEEALRLRADAPEKVTHCMQVYLGRALVDRPLQGQRLPPEVWLGLVLGRLNQSVRSQQAGKKTKPTSYAVSVPACYDQMYRRCIVRAAQIAGLGTPMLVDRPLAAAVSQLNSKVAATPVPDPAKVCHWLVVSIAGNAMEVAALRHLGGQFQMLAAAGSWACGIPAWHQRISDLVSNDCKRKTGIDPRQKLSTAVPLQIACENALRGLMLSPKTELRFALDRKQVSMVLTREAVNAACHELHSQLEGMIREVLSVTELEPAQFERCLMIGTVARLPNNVDLLRRLLSPDIMYQPLDQATLACGVAMAAGNSLLGEASGTGSMSCTSRDLGLIVRNEQEKRKAVTVVPRFTSLPHQSVRRLRWATPAASDEIAIVESANWQGASWRSLGSHHPALAFSGGVGELSFSVDASGLLDVRLRDPSSGAGESIGPLPLCPLTLQELQRWKDWVEETLMVSV